MRRMHELASSVEINIKLLKIVHFLIASLSVVGTKQRRCRDKVASVEEIHASNNGTSELQNNSIDFVWPLVFYLSKNAHFTLFYRHFASFNKSFRFHFHKDHVIQIDTKLKITFIQ